MPKLKVLRGAVVYKQNLYPTGAVLEHDGSGGDHLLDGDKPVCEILLEDDDGDSKK